MISWNMRRRTKRRDAFQRLRDLEAYQLVEGWLLAGVSPRDIAAWIQAGGHLVDIKERSVIRTLQRLRTDLAPSDEIREELLVELNDLVLLVKYNDQRIDAEVERERRLGRLQPETLAVIEAQTELLVQIHQIKRRLGLARIGRPSASRAGVDCGARAGQQPSQ